MCCETIYLSVIVDQREWELCWRSRDEKIWLLESGVGGSMLTIIPSCLPLYFPHTLGHDSCISTSAAGDQTWETISHEYKTGQSWIIYSLNGQGCVRKSLTINLKKRLGSFFLVQCFCVIVISRKKFCDCGLGFKMVS